ncbi:MAG: hypothetical protein PHT33_14695, partial [bacterium]|nr:hypothetical protein [bacterium]
PVSSHGHVRSNLGVLQETEEMLFEKIKGWEELKPVMDVAVVYYLLQHQHTYLGDPSPCDDNNQYAGTPYIDGIEAGAASQEYAGLYRLVEEAGYQAGAVDIMHAPGKLNDYPVVFLPGSPVIERGAADELKAYVNGGGVLVISGPVPGRDEKGAPTSFPGKDLPAGNGEIEMGRGRIIHYPTCLARCEPEEEGMDNLKQITVLLDKYAGRPAVRISPATEVSWIDWKREGGGHRIYRQERNLGTAVLHEGPDEKILFVLNHYPEAVEFIVELQENKGSILTDLDSGEEIIMGNRQALLDIDRKSCRIYRVN